MIEKIGLIILALELAVLAVQDIRYRKISIKLLVIMLAAGAALQGISLLKGDRMGIGVTVFGVVLGLMLSVLGHFFGVIGTGDGIVVIIITLMSGGAIAVVTFLLAITLAGIWAAFLLVFKKVKKKYEIPLIPFLLVSFIGTAFYVQIQAGL
ncbi:MAG: hypothetical protein Q4F11_04975 [Eubacteriales bacterium]|nr:hypothetical protein [Eubacteriales bacterium]